METLQRKVIEKITKVTKYIEGEISINGSSTITHEMNKTKLFLQDQDFEEFVDDDSDNENDLSSDFEESIYNLSIEVDTYEDTCDVFEVSVNDLNGTDLHQLKYDFPDYEVIKMLEKNDGVYTFKKVLVEKERDVASVEEIEDDTIGGVAMGSGHPQYQ